MTSLELQEELKNYMSATEAAHLLKKSPCRIQLLCQQGRFKGAFKFSSLWIIPTESVTSFAPKKRGGQRKDNAHFIKRLFEDNEVVIGSREDQTINRISQGDEAANHTSCSAPVSDGNN